MFQVLLFHIIIVKSSVFTSQQQRNCNKTRSFTTLTEETRHLLPGTIPSTVYGELPLIEDQNLVNITRLSYPGNDCPENTNYQTYSQRAICPWTFILNIDKNRIPREITEAKCLTDSVNLRRKKKCKCSEIKYYTYVLRRTRRTGNSYIYRSVLEPISAGCICVQKPSPRRRLGMRRCKLRNY